MFKKVLRRKRYWPSRRNEDMVYLNHDIKCGGVYVKLEPGQAIVRVKDKELVKVFTSAKKLEEFLEELLPPEMM